MTAEFSRQPRSSQIPSLAKWVGLVIFFLGLAAGITSISKRLEELDRLANIYYHPYLAAVNLSDDFFIWYFLLMEGLLALAFTIVAGLIATQRKVTWMMLFTAIALILFGITVPPPLHSMIIQFGELTFPLRLERASGIAMFVIFLYIFPDGRFALGWTKVLTVILIAWSLIWPFYAPLNPYTWEHVIPFLPFLVISAWCATGVIAQIYRYFNVSNPTAQQQTKLVVFAVTVAVLGDFVTHVAWYIFPLKPGPDCFFLMLHHPFFILSQLVLPISIGVSLLRYGLWEIDLIIYRTLLYGLLTTLVAAVWTASTKLIEEVFKLLLGKEAVPLSAGLAVFVAGATFGPTRKYIDNQIKRYFNIDKVEFGKNFFEFLPEFLAGIELSRLLQIFLNRVSEKVKCDRAAIFLHNAEQELQLAATYKLTPKNAAPLMLYDGNFEQMQKGEVVVRDEDYFPFLIPLTSPQDRTAQPLGVVALGQRLSGRGFSRDELSSLKQLGKQAGYAIYIAQIETENKRELQQQLNILEKRLENLNYKLSKLFK